MKHFWTLIALSLSLHSLSQDVINDTFSMEPGYANMVFYNRSEGVVGTAPLANWHIAFDVAPMGSSIRINGGMGVSLYEYGDADSWDNVDVSSFLERRSTMTKPPGPQVLSIKTAMAVLISDGETTMWSRTW